VSVQIFLSYARIDDELPPHVTDGNGFVTSLYQDLTHSFRQRGDVDTTIWRDTRRVDTVDQFDPVIQQAIDESSILLVVLSPNWITRPYCKRELDRFKERWKHEGEEKLKHRVIVACKRYVEPETRPSLLQGQTGQYFFAFEGPGESGPQYEFLIRGKIRDDRYYDAIEALAGSLYLRAQRLDKNTERERRIIEEREIQFQISRKADTHTRPPVDQNGRKIYLAKPASDMREAYCRLVEELSRAGYAILPDPDVDIPHSSSAKSFVDGALSEAEVSIHLLGEGEGYTPEDSESIVRLQLALAGTKAGVEKNDGSRSGFHRIIWAPEIVQGGTDIASSDGQSGHSESTSSTVAKTRQPQDAVTHFGSYLPGDKIIGDSLSKFVDFLIEHLRQTDSMQTAAERLGEDGWVYVYHEATDAKYASALTKALRQRGIAASLPAMDGNPAELKGFHQKCLLECSAVVLCWANASEVWARVRAHELNLKKLGRSEKFAYRGLFAGPPPGDRKAVFVELPPVNEIDVIVDMTRDERPIFDAIEPFVQLARPHAQ